MSLDRLAQVELQLVMHCCDLQTLLALARCSRRTLAAASHPFAWRCLSPLSLPFVFTPDSSQGNVMQRLWRRLRSRRSPPPPPSLAALVSSSLLCFCDVAVQWRFQTAESTGFPAVVTDAELDALAAVPHLRALDVLTRFDVFARTLESLLRRPGLGGLTALSCTEKQLDEETVRALVDCCPRLSTLSLCDIDRLILSGPQLHLLPALTDLSVSGWVLTEHSACMDVVSRCSSLRRLSLRDLHPRAVHSVFVSPALGATLEHLALHDLNVLANGGDGQPKAEQLDWAAAFANLEALRSLELEGVRDVDHLLPALGAHCARLQSLRIRFVRLTPYQALFCMVPSAAVLNALLAALPALRTLMLSMLPRADYASSLPMRNREDMYQQWLLVHGDLCAFAALHPQTVALRLEA